MVFIFQDFGVGSIIFSVTESGSEYLGIFRFFTIFEKKLFSVSVFHSVFKDSIFFYEKILSLSLNLSESKGFTFFQNILPSVTSFIFMVVITWSRLASMNFCPALPGSWQCYKLLINYILRLHVKRFIRQDGIPLLYSRDPALPGRNFPM